ncbi:winged helix DNA-binding protein [Enterococcus gilvus]|uniref:winged helix DNA-binding protein n=1 Tax=Enterococcus gilvus TaxID=160453 RepID=UPI0028D78ECA|nr:winged helix DNA-binding protein [Enterococcus gilvus]
MTKLKQTTILIYLLAIHELSKIKKVKNTDLTNVLNINASSVSEMLEKLILDGYLERESLTLTEKGQKVISNFKRKLL